jgi:hypothetical protein
MRLYYEFYGGEIVPMNIKSFKGINDYDNIKIIKSLKSSIKKKFNTNLDDFLISNGYEINKCGFCNTPSLYTLEFNIIPYKRSFIIKDYVIKYPKSLYYCYRKNKKCDGVNYNSNSVEFVSKANNLNKEEAIKLIHSRNKTPFYIENHSSEEKYKDYQRRTMDFFDTESEYNEYLNKLKKSHTVESYIKKHGKEKGTELFKKVSKSKDSMSFDFFMKKYKNKEIATKMYNDRLMSVSLSLEGFIKRYGKTLGEKNYKEFCKKASIRHNLSSYIKIYGYEEGYRKRKEWLSKITNKLNFYSKDSVNLFESAMKNDINEDYIYYGENEYFLSYSGGIFYYDFTNTKDKYIIEYNGKIWHPDKDIYTEEEWRNWKHPFNSELSAEDVYLKDKKKIKLAKDNGFKVLVIWDFQENKEEIIRDFIKKI